MYLYKKYTLVHNGNGDNMYIVMIRTVFFYFFIFLIYRIMGKRELGQLSIIDLIVSLLNCRTYYNSIENYKGIYFIFFSTNSNISITSVYIIIYWFKKT